MFREELFSCSPGLWLVFRSVAVVGSGSTLSFPFEAGGKEEKGGVPWMDAGAVKITDLNDFLRPSEVCVLPVGGGMRSTPRPGSVGAPIFSRKQKEEDAIDGKVTKVAAITLSDCISCSGCVTSAETVMMDSESAIKAFQGGLADPMNFAVVSMSQQAAASIGEKYGLSLRATYERLAAFLKSIGACKVRDENIVDSSFIGTAKRGVSRIGLTTRFQILNALTILGAAKNGI